MSSYLVVEGARDIEILAPLVTGAGIKDVHFVAAGGKHYTTSLARSISLSRQKPVAVLVDSDTRDQRVIQEQRQIFEDLLRIPPSSSPCTLFLAVPDLEADLFPDPETFERIFGLHLSEEQRSRFGQERKKGHQRKYGPYPVQPVEGRSQYAGPF
jgi:hypothetical protein